MKKVFIILLTVILIFSMASVVAGAQGDGDTEEINYDSLSNNAASVGATVRLTLEELFKVTLPTEFILNLNDEHDAYVDSEPIVVDVTRLDVGHFISLSVSSENYNHDTSAGGPSWRLVRGSLDNNVFSPDSNAAYLPYRMGLGPSTIHVGKDGNTELNMANANTPAIIASSITSDYSGYHLHVMAAIPTSGSLDSAVYQDTLTFHVKLNTN